MGLLDEVREEQARRHNGPPCSIKTLLATLEPKDRAELEEAMYDTTIPQAVLIDVLLEKRGIRIGRTALGKHRNKKCPQCHR